MRIKPALGLGEMQADGGTVAAIGEKLSYILHMGPGLVFGRKLLQRDKCGRQGFGDNPFVVACDSFSGHRRTPHPGGRPYSNLIPCELPLCFARAASASHTSSYHLGPLLLFHQAAELGLPRRALSRSCGKKHAVNSVGRRAFFNSGGVWPSLRTSSSRRRRLSK